MGTLERVLPFYNSTIVPLLKEGKTVLITAHGNSLRALVKYLDNIDEKSIAGLIAECQKERIFLDYADLEMRLGNIDRCRKIYQKFLEAHPQNPKAWNVYVDLEDS